MRVNKKNLRIFGMFPHKFNLPQEDIYLNEKEESIVENKSTSQSLEIEILTGLWTNNKVLIDNSPTAQILHEKNYFGELLPDSRLELSIIEALLLVERNRLKIHTNDGNQIRSDQILTKIAEDDPQIWIRYLVYRDLRQRGYIVRLGYGDDIHFRIFPRGANPQTDIAKYFIFILEEDNAVRLDLLDKITKQSINSRKILILATVDRLGDITYYQLEQFSLPLNKNKELNW